MNDSACTTSEELHTECPLVSIVIPVYNVSRYLPQCLESVTSQSYRNIEIILIDDGSTDDSGSICDQYAEKDARIHAIHSENRGVSATRNLGLENVSGAYVSFIDSDDWIEAHAIETLVKTASKTGADIVTARYYSEYVGKTIYHTYTKAWCETFRNEEILGAFADGWFGNMIWNKLYRAECFDNTRFPEGYNYEDIATIWKLLKNLAENDGAVTSLSDVLFHFRKRKGSISHSWTFRNINDSWKAHKELYKALPDYREKFLSGGFVAIGRMWESYYGYSKEEKEEAEATLREMHAFSKKYFRRVMKGNYSSVIKMACLISQSRSKPAFWLSYHSGKNRQNKVNNKKILFD